MMQFFLAKWRPNRPFHELFYSKMINFTFINSRMWVMDFFLYNFEAS